MPSRFPRIGLKIAFASLERIMKWRRRLFLISFYALVVIAGAQSSMQDQGQAQETQARGYWVDPSTGLMWAGKDNGKDVNWHKAMKYCRDLRLAGYSDWGLANMAELQGTYDSTADAPGLAGPHRKLRDFTFHVKGNLFLTGNQWSSNYRMDDRGRPYLQCSQIDSKAARSIKYRERRKAA
jgi:hypothetical protein